MATAGGGVQPLTDDEVLFCWSALVDKGQLSEAHLKKFMMQVLGYKLTTTQARDLLHYMDANGDRVVGKEDFKHFMSVSCLDHTDPASFMWTTKVQYRQDNMILSAEAKASKADDDDDRSLDFGGNGGGSKSKGSKASERKTAPLESGERPADVADAAISEQRSGPPSPSKNHPVAGSGAAMARSAGRPRTTSGGVKSRPSAQPGIISSLLVEAPQTPYESAEPVVIAEKEVKPKTRPVQMDTATLFKIDAALKNYESNLWQKLLVFERCCKEDIFKNFAKEEEGSISVKDYHKMLMEYSTLAPNSFPGTLRPADSLASMEYTLRRDLERQGLDAPGDGNPAAPKDLSTYKMPYRIWLDILNGEHMPTEHCTSGNATSKRGSVKQH